MTQKKRSKEQENFYRAAMLTLSLFAVVGSSFSSIFINKNDTSAYAGMLRMVTSIASFTFSVKALRKKLLTVITFDYYALISVITFTQGLAVFVLNNTA